MLSFALLLVLFSNFMEERLQEGKSVLRVDCKRAVVQQPDSERETSRLLPGRQVIVTT